MDSAKPRLKPEITDIAALRRLVNQVNNTPGRARVPNEGVERVVFELAKHYGLALDTAKQV